MTSKKIAEWGLVAYIVAVQVLPVDDGVGIGGVEA